MSYTSTTNPRLVYFVEPAIPRGWIVAAQVKGYPASEATGTIHMEEQDAEDEARALAGHAEEIRP